MILKIFPTTLHNPNTRRILHAQPEDIQELLHKLLKDLQIIREELAEYINSPSWNRPAFYDDDDDDDEYTIQYREYLENSSNAITPVLPIEEPDNTLSITSNSELVNLEEVKDDILHEKLLNINHLIDYDLPSSDDFSPISIFEEKSVTFSNPLFDSNDDFTSSDNESLSDEDVPEDNFKIYSNPIFEFDDVYISSDVNPLFDEVLEYFESKDSYDSNLDESTFLVTPLFDSNEDECLAPSDDIELLPHPDPSISIVSILEGFTDEPPLEENDDLFDLESKGNEWKKILYDAPIDDVIFYPGGDIDKINAFLDIDISTDIEDGYHDSEGDILYLESLLSNDTILTLPLKLFLDHDPRSLVVSFLPLSSGSEDTIFDPGISAFHFSSLEPVAFESQMEDCSSTCFDCPDFEDSRARGFVPRSLDLQSLSCLFMGIRYPRSY
ncbi:hypothetical protein Tco_1514478 [Tanacetum coccineum]